MQRIVRFEETIREKEAVLPKLTDYFDGLPKVPRIPTLFSLSLRKIVSGQIIPGPGDIPKKLAQSIKLIKEAPGTYKKTHHEATIGREDRRYFPAPYEVTVAYDNDLEEWSWESTNGALDWFPTHPVFNPEGFDDFLTIVMTKPMWENYKQRTYYTENGIHSDTEFHFEGGEEARDTLEAVDVRFEENEQMIIETRELEKSAATGRIIQGYFDKKVYIKTST